MKSSKKLALLMAIGLLGGCASVDAQDRFLLGEASRANVAAQASRDVNLPNSKTVDSTSGVRAVNAMKALNEGQTRELASTSTGGGE
jgi:uncharacterized protein YceK